MKIVLQVLVAIALFSCGSKLEREPHFIDPTTNAEFDEFKKAFVDTLCHYKPTLAIKAGLDYCDTILVIPTRDALSAEVAFAQQALTKLNGFQLNVLSNNNLIDYYWIKNIAESATFELEGVKEWEWNPAFYNLKEDFEVLLKKQDLDLAYRMDAIGHKLKWVPEFYVQAKMNLYKLSFEHTQAALKSLKQSLLLFEIEIPDSLKKMNDQQINKADFGVDLANAKEALHDYIGWLQNDILPTMEKSRTNDFHVGKEKYSRKFELETQSIYKAEEIYAKAMEAKGEVIKKMELLSDSLWHKYFNILKKPQREFTKTKLVLDSISKVYDTLGSQLSQDFFTTSSIVEFAQSKDLLPDDFFTKNAEITKDENTNMPIRRLLDFIAEQTFLYHQKEGEVSLYTSFDERSLYSGWSLYFFRMILEQGFGNGNAELWMMYYNEHLQHIVKAVLAYDIHARGMNRREAMEMMTIESFLSEEEAEEIWNSVILTPVKSSMDFSNYYEIIELKEEVKSRLGSAFEWEDFHEYLLSFGNVPINHIRIEMMGNGNGIRESQ